MQFWPSQRQGQRMKECEKVVGALQKLTVGHGNFHYQLEPHVQQVA